jgi:hypothetical protein
MAILYRHIRLDKNEPFYIGIGKTIKRAYSSINRNNYWHNIVGTDKKNYRIEILFEGISYEEAILKEKEFILLYGRKDLGKGSLVNVTDGGEGTLGRIVSKELRKKLSTVNPKIWLGKKRPELAEMTIKMNKERVWSKESRDKLSKSRSGSNHELYGKFGKDHHTSKSIICVNTGITYESIRSASQILNLNHGHIASVVRGVLKATGHKKYPGGLTFKQLIN